MPRTKIFIAFLIFIVSTFAGAAEPLTNAQIANYVKSGSEFKQWTEKHQATLKASYMKVQQSSPQGTSGRKIMEKSMLESGLTDELASLIKPYGFSDVMQYLTVSQRIMKAAMAISMQAQAGKGSVADARMAEALKRLDETDMPEEKKAQLRQMLKNTHSQMATMAKAPEADVAAVKPHMDGIRKAFGMP